ncbi:hypothetical protein GCM10009665_35790 [Kitasatospora nipponensis]|uniref:Immunity protein 50 of polymorphic toxin system n=1 Tax=Kitasatospora nipponensis TaxID=258049 RepID=A0ABN1WAE9_9ACTN
MSTSTQFAAERIHVDHAATRRLGRWTTAGRFEVRARSGSVQLDLRSPDLPDELELHLDLRRSALRLLLPEDAALDQWGLQWTARGRVKDGQAPQAAGTRLVRLVGAAENSEIRIHRGGVAIVSAMLSREYLQDLRAARAAGRYPTLDDPARRAA